MVTISWQGWHWVGKETKAVEEILKTHIPNDIDKEIVCAFDFGPSGGFCDIGINQDFLLQDLMSKDEFKQMLEDIVATILTFKNWSGNQAFSRTSMKDIFVATVPPKEYYKANIKIFLKY